MRQEPGSFKKQFAQRAKWTERRRTKRIVGVEEELGRGVETTGGSSGRIRKIKFITDTLVIPNF